MCSRQTGELDAEVILELKVTGFLNIMILEVKSIVILCSNTAEQIYAVNSIS